MALIRFMQGRDCFASVAVENLHLNDDGWLCGMVGGERMSVAFRAQGFRGWRMSTRLMNKLRVPERCPHEDPTFSSIEVK